MAALVLGLATTVGGVVLETTTSIFQVIFVPWRSSYGPIKSFLNVDDDFKDIQTSSWRDRKLAELTFVGITCALITGAVVQALTWPPVLTPSRLPLGLWYSSLLLSLVAICLATQQSVALNRLSSYGDCTSRIRDLLGQKLVSEGSGRGETWVPRMLQLYVWQTPIMLLNFGILTFIVGLGVMVFENRNGVDNNVQVSMGLDAEALVIFGFAGTFAALNYVFSTGVLYHGIHAIER